MVASKMRQRIELGRVASVAIVGLGWGEAVVER